MNSDTGEIRNFTEKELKELSKDQKGRWVPAPDDLSLLERCNRSQKRYYAKLVRKGMKLDEAAKKAYEFVPKKDWK